MSGLRTSADFAAEKMAAGIGTPADPPATTDAGTFGIISLLKRMLARSPLVDVGDGSYSVRPGGVRRDSDSPYTADGGWHPFLFTSGGRLKVSASPADISQVVGVISASGGAVPIQVLRLSNLSISMVAASLTGHNVTFEASNNSTNGTDGNWYAVQVVRSNANTVATASGVLTATPVYMWQVNVSDYAWFRVRATAHTGGTATYTLNPSSYVSEPIPAIQVTSTQPVSGTVTANPTAPTANLKNSAAGTNATSAKTSAGTMWAVNVSNVGGSAAYLKYYNKASAPVVGTDVPVLVIPVPAGAAVSVNGGSAGTRFTTGIAFAITGGAADSDTTSVAANDIKVITSYT